MKYISMLLGVGAMCLTACNLEREPHASITAAKVQAQPDLYIEPLNRALYAQLKSWSDPMYRCGEYAGDNIAIRGASTDAFYEFISFSRTPQNYRLQSFWDSSYKAIAQASNIINKFLPEKSNDAGVKNKIGECHFIRGLMYFYLVRAYGKPYYQEPSKNLGVPIVNGTPDKVDATLFLSDRATVEEVYKHIIQDLERASELLTINRGPSYASKEAAQALLSRVYLYMSGTYEQVNRDYAQKAVDYADKVINSGKYTLLSRPEFMKYNTIVPESNKESIFVVRRRASEYSGYAHYFGIGGMYAKIGGMGWGEMFASAKYIDMLNETGRNDWRPVFDKDGNLDQKVTNIVDARAAFIEPNYLLKGDENEKREDLKKKKTSYIPVFRFIYESVDKNGFKVYNYNQLEIKTKTDANHVKVAEKVGTEEDPNKEELYDLTLIDESQDKYSIDYKGKTYEGYLDYYVNLNRALPEFYIVRCSREGEESHLHSPIISRLGEIYLNRAEALAKLGRYDEALRDLNTIRTRSIPEGAYASLSAGNAGDLIDKERQLELAFHAERSYDVFRNGKSLSRHYPGAHNQNEVISATDYRVIYFIPQNAINAYPGKLTQNPTSN